MDYINTFLKLEAEASGHPGSVHSPEEKNRNVCSFWQSDGIRLDKETVTLRANFIITKLIIFVLLL